MPRRTNTRGPIQPYEITHIEKQKHQTTATDKTVHASPQPYDKDRLTCTFAYDRIFTKTDEKQATKGVKQKMPTITETVHVPFWHQIAHIESQDYQKLIGKIIEKEMQKTEDLGLDQPIIRVSALETIVTELTKCGLGNSDKQMKQLPPKAPDTYWSVEQQALLLLDHTGEKATLIIRDYYEKQITKTIKTESAEETSENQTDQT